ncbi:MAG TPA: epoxide hydrolase N-terminal domain-containing protein [Trebonia sp.]|nr:epoxide hydrolase N-terminal domain-containing protein [Trebonia sp.]
MSSETEIRSFRVDMPDEAIADLRRRIAATRWPTKELVADRSQGVQLATLRELARYWATEYDWRACEERLNALPQFKTGIDGEDVHFIHVRSRHENALPLIITHGRPGSAIGLLRVIGPLTDPTAHGGSVGDAFDLVLPSVPGYGFSAEPTEAGWNVGCVAGAWAELMRRLGYDRYVARGGDVGAAVTDAMGRQAPEGLLGIHMNLLLAGLAGGYPSADPTEAERAALDAIATFRTSGNGYLIEQNTRPQTIGYALLDSPVALAAWVLDHDTEAYYKISRAFLDGQPSGGLTRDQILDNITMYWLTGTGASAARSYWKNTQAAHAAAGKPRPEVKLPVGFTTFPGEIWRTRAAGSRRPTPTSPTSTRSTKAATSPPGRNPNCSRPRSERPSSRCANHSPHWSCGSAHLARFHMSLRCGNHDTYWRNSHAYHESPPSSSWRRGRRPRGGCRQRRRDHRPECRGGQCRASAEPAWPRAGQDRGVAHRS